jgi:hypothetical protein
MLAAATRAGAVDTYDPATRQLTIPTLKIGAATYSDVVVSIARVVSGPSGTSATGSVDSYDPASGELKVPEVFVGSIPYFNVVAAIGYLASIGSVSGADGFSDTILTVPTLQQGNMLFSGVKMMIATANVIGISGGMPAAIRDQFDPADNVLIIPAVQVGSKVYTNVTVSASNGNVLSVGGKSPIVVVGASPSFIVSSTAVSVIASPTAQEPTATVTFAIGQFPAKGVYYGYAWVGGAINGIAFSFDSTIGPNGARNGSVQLQFDEPSLQGSGSHTSTVSLLICLDMQCQTPVAGSPQTIAVTYTVTGDEAPQALWTVTPSTLSFESPSNGPALSTTLSVLGFNLPPYGAYLFVRQSSGGIVQSINFDNLSDADSDANTNITLNLSSPAELGPGIYSDTLAVLVCYDPACAQQAVGSPWIIPLSYSVDASEGSEYQVRVLPISATAIAADPSGQNLYVATWDYSGQGAPPTLVKVDPATGSTLGMAVLPGPAQQVVVSADGSYAYVNVDIQTEGKSQIERINLSTMAIDEEILFNQLYSTITDLSVSPLSPHTIGVAAYFPGEGGNLTGAVEVFDDAVVRPDVLTGAPAPGSDPTQNIQWSLDGATIFIESGFFSEQWTLLQSTVSSAGLAPPATLLQPTYGDGIAGRFHSMSGLLYSDGGGVIDPSQGAIIGQYVLRTPTSDLAVPILNANVLPDASTGRTFAVYADNTATTGDYQTLQSYSLAQFGPLMIARSPVALSSPVRWGTDGLAFMGVPPHTSAQYYVYLINGSFVSSSTGAISAGQARNAGAHAPPEVASFIIRRAP